MVATTRRNVAWFFFGIAVAYSVSWFAAGYALGHRRATTVYIESIRDMAERILELERPREGKLGVAR
jgi:hypothetical protein